MFFYLVLTSCVRTELHQQSELTSRGRLMTSDGSSPRTLNSQNDWYFVKFHDIPDFQALKSYGINIESKNMITTKWYQLFLSGEQARMMTLQGNTLQLIHDKVLTSTVPIENADILDVETSSTFNPSLVKSSNLILRKKSETFYTARSPNLQEAAHQLASIPEVYAVTPRNHYKMRNIAGAGYSQMNTKTLRNGGFDRYLNKRGLTGQGITVTVLDTYLDTNSTYFYDPENPVIENDVFNPKHRKVVYSWKDPSYVETNGEHGTHVCGTIAGQAQCVGCAADDFNGVAPDAKLAFHGWFMNDQDWDLSDARTQAIMNMTNSSIVSNSWASEGWWPSEISRYDATTFQNPDKLWVFCAGNSGLSNPKHAGYTTVESPCMSKNILTVGALAQLEIENLSMPKRYFVESISSEMFMVTAELMPWSKNAFGKSVQLLHAEKTSNITSDKATCFLADSIEQIEEIVDCKFVVVRKRMETEKKVPFPVFYIESERMWNALMGGGHVRVMEEHRDEYGEFTTSPWSSRGPSVNGIMKPEIVTPGTMIQSARSSVNGSANHDLEPLELIAYQGTSMATPNAAGCAALVQQYFSDRKYYKNPFSPSGSLLKAMLVTAAEPLPAGTRSPNAQTGFGQVNLGRYLPIDGDDFAILVNDTVSIENNQHLLTSIYVSNTSRDLRVTISYMDPPTSADSLIPLVNDIDLIVKSPSGRVYRGNQYNSSYDERFSTTERVIILPGEVELGEYTIHILASLGPTESTARFSIVVVGQVLDSRLVFRETAECATSCGTGVCKVGMCVCEREFFVGNSCQQPVMTVNAGETSFASVDAFGIGYVRFPVPVVKNHYNMTMMVVQTSPDLNTLVYYSYGSLPKDHPRDYDGGKIEALPFIWTVDISSYNENMSYSMLIRNNAHERKTYTVISILDWLPQQNPEPTPKIRRLSVNESVTIVVLVVIFVGTVALLWYICSDKRKIRVDEFASSSDMQEHSIDITDEISLYQ